MPSIDELLDEHARNWREDVDAHDRHRAAQRAHGVAAHPVPRRRRALIAAAVVSVCVGGTVGAGLVLHSRSADNDRVLLPAAPIATSSSPSPTDRAQSGSYPPQGPAPSPPAQAWGVCGNIRGLADARSLVESGDALIEARLSGAAVLSYTVLAGRVDGLHDLYNVNAPAGRYIVVVGGPSGGGRPDYYAANGYYGVYRVLGARAYQMCAYNHPPVPRGGVMSAKRIIELFQLALRRG